MRPQASKITAMIKEMIASRTGLATRVIILVSVQNVGI
jgi:hypothetical protein